MLKPLAIYWFLVYVHRLEALQKQSSVSGNK